MALEKFTISRDDGVYECFPHLCLTRSGRILLAYTGRATATSPASSAASSCATATTPGAPGPNASCSATRLTRTAS